MAYEELDFSGIEQLSIPVRVRDKCYVLHDASGDAAAKHRNAVLKYTKLGADGRPTLLEGVADTEPYLVSMCLFELVKAPDGTEREAPVSIATIRSWPQRVQSKLFEKVKEISELSEVDTEASLKKQIGELQAKLEKLQAQGDPLKNAPGDTTDGLP
jgi:hypothetical protein